MSDIVKHTPLIKTVQLQSKHGHTVTVAHGAKQLENSLHAVLIVGICGGSRHEHVWTIGADDGPRPAPPTADELQKYLNEKRQQVADEASWKESVRTAVSELA